MNKKEKNDFINELIEDVKADILEKLKNFPQEWKGIELKWVLRKKSSYVSWKGYFCFSGGENDVVEDEKIASGTLTSI